MTVHDQISPDDDLRNRFAAMRRQEAGQAPEFAVPSINAAGQRSRLVAGKLSAVAACLAVIAAAVFLLRTGPVKRGSETPAKAGSISQWRAPTDFLLETPGREFLQTVPAIGVSPNYTGARGAGQKSRSGKPVLR